MITASDLYNEIKDDLHLDLDHWIEEELKVHFVRNHSNRMTMGWDRVVRTTAIHGSPVVSFDRFQLEMEYRGFRVEFIEEEKVDSYVVIEIPSQRRM